MNIGILSDIHSNLAALQAVVAEFRRRRVDQIVCLGDIVGYGPEPNECIEIIRERAEITILGNHDCMAVGSDPFAHINLYARQAMDWTREVLLDDHRKWLLGLPYEVRGEGRCFVHASPRFPADWEYIGRVSEATVAFDYFEEQLCFVGHTHRPAIFVKSPEKGVYSLKETVYAPSSDERLVVNIGSVGQPRDGNSRASAAVWDGQTVELFRVDYDYRKTQRKMRSFGLPPVLAKRLVEGV